MWHGPVLAGAAFLAGGCLLGLWRRFRRLHQALETTGAEVSRLRALVNGMPDIWFAEAENGTGHAAGAGLAALLGRERLRGLESIEQALAPSDAAALHGSFAHLRRTGQPFTITVRLADGSRTLQAMGRRGTAGEGAAVPLLVLRDITAETDEIQSQSAARRAIEAEQQALLRMLDTLPMPLWRRARDTRLLWCNQAFAHLLDSSPEQVVDRQLELPAAGFGYPPRALALQARESGTAQSESRFLVVNGERRLFELTECMLPGPDGLLGFAVDRTRERELRDELDRHVAAHGEVLEQLGSAIAIYGADTRLRFYNRAYARLWDLNEDWLASEPLYGEILEDLRTRRKLTEEVDFAQWKRRRLAEFTSLLEPMEDLMHLPDGRTLRTLSVPHPFGGLMYVLEDVTHTLALESSYNTLMAVQQETLDNLAEGVAVFGGDGRLKLSNPAFARLWRVPPDDLWGEPHAGQLIDRFRPLLDDGSDWQEQRQVLAGRLLERVPVGGTLILTDGSVIRYAQVPLPDGAVLLSCLDISDSVRVEQALRASNEALEAADRLKSEFIANVSYQLRTPLNAIMGFAEILHNQYFGALNPRQLEYARGVLEASRRLLVLVNDILDLATIEAGYMVLDRDVVDVAQLVQSVAGLTRDWARKQALDLRVAIADGPGLMEGDEKRLKQALFNLVSNAIKFTPAGGHITIGACRDGDGVLLSVSDTGVGIPRQDQERVLHRFERGQGGAGTPGAGLGLALVKSFIELHGGTLDIQSNPDQGTTVLCRLPLHPPSAAAGLPQDGPPQEGGGSVVPA